MLSNSGSTYSCFYQACCVDKLCFKLQKGPSRAVSRKQTPQIFSKAKKLRDFGCRLVSVRNDTANCFHLLAVSFLSPGFWGFIQSIEEIADPLFLHIHIFLLAVFSSKAFALLLHCEWKKKRTEQAGAFCILQMKPSCLLCYIELTLCKFTEGNRIAIGHQKTNKHYVWKWCICY